MIECKVCKKTFKSERALHCHLKAHDMTIAEYYTQFFPRKNKLTGENIPFKDKDSYFDTDFNNYSELKKWCNITHADEVKEYILKLLKKRISSRNLNRAPGHLELLINKMPTIDHYRTHFGSYSKASSLLGVKPLFEKALPPDFNNCDTSMLKIFIDTREQQPLSFANSEVMALNIGDYTAAGSFYDRTYIDRKSTNDFIATLSLSNLDRFKREIERVRKADSYLFILIESNLNSLEAYMRAAKNKKFGPHKTNLKFIYHNMRQIMHEFQDCCQFVFADDRGGLENIIPKILFFGSIIWGVDLQYYIDKNELDIRKSK